MDAHDGSVAVCHINGVPFTINKNPSYVSIYTIRPDPLGWFNWIFSCHHSSELSKNLVAVSIKTNEKIPDFERLGDASPTVFPLAGGIHDVLTYVHATIRSERTQNPLDWFLAGILLFDLHMFVIDKLYLGYL